MKIRTSIYNNQTYQILCLLLFMLLSLPSFSQTQIGEDIDGEAAFDNSGRSVSLSSDGRFVAIGGNGNDGSGNFAGHVRVYENQGGSWMQIGEDIDGEAADDGSGSSVSLSSDGRFVAIGAPGNNGNGNFGGHVRVYENQGGSWMQIGEDIDGEAAGDNSGSSVSLSSDGRFVAIGAPGNNGFAGHVRVYENQGGSWMQIGEDIDGEAAFDQSGFSVSLSSDGRFVAIGANGNNGNGNFGGHVRVYENQGGSWMQIGEDIDGEAAFGGSGWSVSLSSDGRFVAIGAINNDGNGNFAGHVRVYENQVGSWMQIGEDIDGEAADDQSGWSVSLSSDGRFVAIGAPGNNGFAGHVRVYENQGGSWMQIGEDIDGEAADDQSGWSVSLSSDGRFVAIGARFNDGTASDAGHVRVYENDIPAVPTMGQWALFLFGLIIVTLGVVGVWNLRRVEA